MKTGTPKPNKSSLGGIFLKVLLAAGMLLFLSYGLSFYLPKPTVETITTRAPQFNSNNPPMQDVKFQPDKKR